MMGWWKPYFFFDPDGVQLLLPTFALHSYMDLFLAAIPIGLICVADRVLKVKYSRARD